MKHFFILILSFSLLFCSPKGPQTFDSPFVGKTKEDLIHSKGKASKIKIFEASEAYIYISKEEYFGKKTSSKINNDTKPKKTIEIENIYYINKKGYIYKYQVWKKRVD